MFSQYKNVNNKFKTSLCKDFDISNMKINMILGGRCPMDIRCHYAHGKLELRDIDDVLNIYIKYQPVPEELEPS